MKNSKLATVLGIVIAVVGALQSVNIVPLVGPEQAASVGAVIGVVGAIVAALGKALNAEHPSA